jgi:hypothetical protein
LVHSLRNKPPLAKSRRDRITILDDAVRGEGCFAVH